MSLWAPPLPWKPPDMLWLRYEWKMCPVIEMKRVRSRYWVSNCPRSHYFCCSTKADPIVKKKAAGTTNIWWSHSLWEKFHNWQYLLQLLDVINLPPESNSCQIDEMGYIYLQFLLYLYSLHVINRLLLESECAEVEEWKFEFSGQVYCHLPPVFQTELRVMYTREVQGNRENKVRNGLKPEDKCWWVDVTNVLQGSLNVPKVEWRGWVRLVG